MQKYYLTQEVQQGKRNNWNGEGSIAGLPEDLDGSDGRQRHIEYLSQSNVNPSEGFHTLVPPDGREHFKQAQGKCFTKFVFFFLCSWSSWRELSENDLYYSSFGEIG